MELRHLRYFLAVAEELHFARAASRLGIEQSPLSRQIQDLEADLKVRLFERTRRATTLTKAGERFIIDARRILADVDGSVRALRTFAIAGQPVRLGLAEGLAGPPFGRLLQLCQAAEPAINIVLFEYPLAELIGLVLAGGLDAILAPEPATTSELESVPVWSEPLSVVAPHAGRGVSPVWLKAFANRPWILPDPKSLPGSARQIESLLSGKGLTLRADVTAATPATLNRLVAAGAGIGLLPDSLTRTTDGVTARPLRDPDATVTTWLTIRRDDGSPVLPLFRKHVEAAAAEPQPPARP
jgi:DNA-binding transcriptional LysR family regulator